MLNKDKLGFFSASSGHKLFTGGKGVTREKYIIEKAEEVVRKHFKKQFKNKHTDHGNLNEYEAITTFKEMTGLLVEYLDQQFFPVNEYLGATPDAKVVDFSGKIIASCDVKCPTESFFEQKLLQIQESKPKFQNVPKDMFFQAQIQMMALTEFNKKLGHPPVEEHYLVRYMTSMDVDDDGNKIEYDLPLEVRMFYKLVKVDLDIQKEILQIVETAGKERDAYVKLMLQPII